MVDLLTWADAICDLSSQATSSDESDTIAAVVSPCPATIENTAEATSPAPHTAHSTPPRVKAAGVLNAKSIGWLPMKARFADESAPLQRASVRRHERR